MAAKAGFMQERRAQSRVLFNRDVYLTSSGGKSISCTAYDFSMNGLGVFTDQELTAGETITVEFQIMSNTEWREINLRGRVAYSRQQNKQYKTGISFY